MLRHTSRTIRPAVEKADAVVQARRGVQFPNGRGLLDKMNGLNVWCKVTVLRLERCGLGEGGGWSLAEALLLENSVPNAGGQRLPAAGGDRAWAARTGSGPMRMCGDIFAAARLWRGRLLTIGRLSCRHPVVVCAGRGGRVAVSGRSVAWACSGRGAAICVRVSSSVNHL